MSKFQVDPIFRLYDTSGNAYFDVTSNPDIPDMVNLRTDGVENEKFFGKLDLSLTTENARLLATILNKVADLIEEFPVE